MLQAGGPSSPNMGIMQPWFVMVPMWMKQRLIDRCGSVEEALRQEQLPEVHGCIGVHFTGSWTERGEKYLWDGTRAVDEETSHP